MEDLLQIQELVRKFIIKASYVEEEQVNNNTLIFELGIMDSMGFMSLIAFIEESFSIQAKDNDLLEANFESVEAIASFVSRKLSLS